jgi:hypothetical protein
VRVKTSKFANTCTTLLIGARNHAPHRENTHMARHTRIKLAALATSFVAALGIVAVSPATASHAGGVLSSRDGGRSLCC